MSNDGDKLDALHEAILEKLEEGRATPKYIADHVGESRQLISNRLRDLRMSGHVTKVHTGLYELADDDWREDAGDDDHDDDLRQRAEAALDELDVPGRDPATERNRREAILWAWEFLRRRGEATSSEIANATFGYFWDVDLGYSVSSRYPGYGLWDNCVREALAALPGVDAPPEKGNEWAFVEA